MSSLPAPNQNFIARCKMTDAPRAFILCGPSGSGKTTARTEILRIHDDAIVASADDVLMAIATEKGLTYQEAYRDHAADSETGFQEQLATALRERRTVIIDRTNLTINKRQNFIIQFQKAGYVVVGVLPEVNPKTEAGRTELLRRAAVRMDRGAPMPAHVIEAQIEAYEPITEAERGIIVTQVYAFHEGDDHDDIADW